MPEYNIAYTAEIHGTVTVEANSYDEAYDLAKEAADKEAPPCDHLRVEYEPNVIIMKPGQRDE